MRHLGASRVLWGSWGGLGAAKNHDGIKKIEKGAQSGDLFGTFASFWPLGGSFGGPGGQKERPEGTRGRSCGHRKNINFHSIFVGFWSFGPPGKARVWFTNRLGQPRVWFTRGTWGRLFGMFFALEFRSAKGDDLVRRFAA